MSICNLIFEHAYNNTIASCEIDIICLQVPYHSLSWCKNWLGSKVNITRAPQVFLASVCVQAH